MDRTLTRMLLVLAALLLSACGTTRVLPQAELPPPLIDKVKARVGVHYPDEFSGFIHKEKRYGLEFEVTLGSAHVKNLDWLLGAMFTEVVRVKDISRAREIQPPLDMILQPRFEEFAFLTPRDLAGEAFIVTIRYLLSVYDGTGARVDGYVFTGYGRAKGSGISNTKPLSLATQKAMRDAGAKVATELVAQESVRVLLGGKPVLGSPAPGGS